MTPVYNHFFSSILNNGRNALESLLVYEDGAYHIDFADLEAKLADPQTSMMILCNPQNPAGIIWDRATLARIGELCTKHGVLVVSDEIHCDLTDPGKEYIPFASVNETCRDNSITCIAPTKTFNLAGLQTSAIVVPNPWIRHKVWRGINTDEVAEPNVFGGDRGCEQHLTRGQTGWISCGITFMKIRKQSQNLWKIRYRICICCHRRQPIFCGWIAVRSRQTVRNLQIICARRPDFLFPTVSSTAGTEDPSCVLISPARKADASGWTGTFKSRCPIL